ncbi:MAG: response regulator [Cellvibrionales bacterium]|jgi:YesN/AraC family two-component response regulator|nr:response regulator [Cellvibrionales bacterium]
MKMQRNLLCVDDESGILKSLTRSLRNEDFTVLTASSHDEALTLLSENDVQVILVDQHMPDIDGLNLIKKIKVHHPFIIPIILSGLVDMEYVLAAINRGDVQRFLAKPWNDEELKTVLRQCFHYFDLAHSNLVLNDLVSQQKIQLENLTKLLKEHGCDG